jgi:hypothetical protein
MVEVILPSVLAALGLTGEDDAAPEHTRGEGVLSITAAALEAVESPGTEIDGTEVAGRQRGVRGRWVELRRRRRHPATEVETPDEHEAAHGGGSA